MNTEKQKVLIVDDEADLANAIATALSYEGFETLIASDGEIGLESALTKEPALILLDIIMPKMDGLTMLKKLRADDRGKYVKVIVMTALDDLEKIAEVVDAGGDEYILKNDITLSNIVEKVKSRLGVNKV